MDRQYVQPEDAEELDFGGPEELPIEESESEVYMTPEGDESMEEAEALEAPVVQEEKPKKVNIGQRLSEVQREKYRALEELRQSKAEIERLRSLADASTHTALQHYDQAVLQRLQAARENKIKALETGDVTAQADADIALSMATSEFQQLNNLKAQQQVSQQPYYQQNSYYQEPTTPFHHVQENVNDWALKNTWFHPASSDYDENLASDVHAYCNAFDNNLYRAGRASEIGSPEYLDIIDGFVQEARKYHSQSNRGRDLPMRNSRSSVSPVRGGYSGQSEYSGGGSVQTGTTSLTPAERDMARRLGLDEKVYLQYRLKDQKENPHKRVRRG